MILNDTIAAISTAVSNGGIGIVRISGSESFSIIDQIFSSIKKEKKVSEQKSHTIHYGHIKKDEEIIDEVLVSIMRGPNSYTAEDTIEINCHGGILVVRKILELVLEKGARLAEPGEFTKRAFLNGRMDLSQAEAVMDIIESKNEYALKSSMSQLKGAMMKSIQKIRDRIIYHVAYIESALDDPEHISLEGYDEKLREENEVNIKDLERLRDTADSGRIIKEGIKTVIVGKPNAGKSSVLNALLGEDRAIVTDVAGTTRDTLEETMNLGSLTLHMVDTAGIRKTQDKVEKIGVERAREFAEQGDLIIYVVDASIPLQEEDMEIIEFIKDQKVFVLLNKSDLHSVVKEEEMKKYLDAPTLLISAKEGLGIDKFTKCLEEMFYHGKISFNEEVYLTNARHKEAVLQALESLHLVETSIDNQMPEDFWSIDLMAAYEALGGVTGESVGEDLVNEIFSKFCTGK